MFRTRATRPRDLLRTVTVTWLRKMNLHRRTSWRLEVHPSLPLPSKWWLYLTDHCLNTLLESELMLKQMVSSSCPTTAGRLSALTRGFVPPIRHWGGLDCGVKGTARDQRLRRRISRRHRRCQNVPYFHNHARTDSLL